MAEVVLFHHLRGLTDGVLALADGLRAGGHTVHTPDLFGGVRPASLEEGAALAKEVDERDWSAFDGSVYAGVSWGVMLAQRLAQTRPGARGALLYEACLPVSGEWAIGPWPEGVPVQIHGMDADPFFAGEGDIDAAKELTSITDLAQLYVYKGDRHLFTDSSLPSYDADATALVLERSREFLAAR
ncbi:dienelactone hydrolase family protein [Dactylosporangium vinaceum]|uniref:Dienelactone hydrolase family protein n=1 Tax=Dactylosporangium vinaceum TaxID=53362 RepID=A0ABV5MS37_9ACTN|nr:dienelactone hydrolase family protein [Dactylosporangium vinaceum]UAC00249.1 dienelactone hydrolase family protein [Dactylosporangium vinaceum]